ncbi:YlbL family protein [Arthrobacter livingstonensis]|uniref:YlbL family protein n=1 Tax=Arthrobacter livingstonensis TaxID=670078 RepID=UPI001FE7433F|nr:S16 family serine protease [Arthrobacter livingstonensis]
MSQENHDVAPQPVKAKAAVRDGRVSLMVVSGVIAAVLAVAALAIPVPYVVESPGPAINTIGKVNGQPVISVTGHDSFPATSGALDLTTVHMTGGLPDSQINIFEALRAWLTPSDTIYPAELIYAPGTSQDAVNSENSAAMTGSQENATAAAFKALGIDYKTVLAVASVPTDGASAGILKPDDVLLAIGGKDITGLPAIEAVLAAGKGAPVEVKVQRGGADKTVTVTPRANKDGKYLLGIALQNKFTFPFTVDITLSNIGGPSAGTMFALGIMDTLTKGGLTGGKHFAGTGTIDPDGNVGAIGGIAQKMVGARNNGADYFLAPAANCGDVVGHVPNGLHVVKVATLKEAYAAVTAIGSGADGSTLPACK